MATDTISSKLREIASHYDTDPALSGMHQPGEFLSLDDVRRLVRRTSASPTCTETITTEERPMKFRMTLVLECPDDTSVTKFTLAKSAASAAMERLNFFTKDVKLAMIDPELPDLSDSDGTKMHRPIARTP